MISLVRRSGWSPTPDRGSPCSVRCRRSESRELKLDPGDLIDIILRRDKDGRKLSYDRLPIASRYAEQVKAFGGSKHGRGRGDTVERFGAVLEHPTTCVDCMGRVDVDSGPVFMGFGVSATGFAIGASRANDDRDAFVSLYATAHLFGAPFDDGATRTYATGGPLGDAILLAMLSAPRPARPWGPS